MIKIKLFNKEEEVYSLLSDEDEKLILRLCIRLESLNAREINEVD